MAVFISKYELRTVTIKEDQFHNRDNTMLYSRKIRMILPKLRIMLKYMLLYGQILYFVSYFMSYS
jgi:hypothetical protein